MISEGSMIVIDYSARIQDGEKNQIFDTTLIDVAKEENIFKQNKVYEPMLIVLGEQWVPVGLEKALMDADVGDEFEIVVPSDQAYGPKDPSKIKLVARREFQKMNINPSVGDRITIGSQVGSVLSVTSSRVRMDYNHVLAGKDIIYQVKIHKTISQLEEKVFALIKRRLPGAKLDELKVSISNGKISVSLPEQIRYLEYIQFAKKEIAKDIKEILPKFTNIIYQEEFDLNQL